MTQLKPLLIFLASTLLFISCATTPKATRTPAAEKSERLYIPISPEQREKLWAEVSKSGRLYVNSSVPQDWGAVQFGVCSRGSIILDLTKIDFEKFRPGPVDFFDDQGSKLGTGILAEFKSWEVEHHYKRALLGFTDVHVANKPEQFELIYQSNTTGIGNDRVGIYGCLFTANMKLEDIIANKKLVQSTALESPTASNKNPKPFKVDVWTDLKNVRGILDGRTIGNCKFSYNAEYDVLNVGYADPNLGADDQCELSKDLFVYLQKPVARHYEGYNYAYNDLPFRVTMKKDGPYLFAEGQLDRIHIAATYMQPDSSHPKLGEAYRDIYGTIWGSVAPERMMRQRAIDYCTGLGAVLPGKMDFARLVGGLHGMSFFLPDGREKIPALSKYDIWTRMTSITIDKQGREIGHSRTYNWLDPSFTGWLNGERGFNTTYDPTELHYVRCVISTAMDDER